MRYLKMLDGTPSTVEAPVWIERVAAMTSDVNGIFYPAVKRGTYVQKGMKVGHITDYLGTIIFEARAPESGRGPVHPGGAVDDQRGDDRQHRRAGSLNPR